MYQGGEGTAAVCSNKTIGPLSWCGSGVWEHTENRRWVAVENQILPNLDENAGESSLVAGLGVGQYVQNFENEADIDNNADYEIVTSGSTMIRICTKREEEQTGEGSSSGSRLHEIDINLNVEDGNDLDMVTGMLNSTTTHTSIEDPVPGPSNFRDQQSDGGQTSTRNSSMRSSNFVKTKRNQRKRQKSRKRKLLSLSRGFSHKGPLSVNSSPGRNTPSPNSLEKLCASLDNN